MDVNTRPLLDNTDSESENDDSIKVANRIRDEIEGPKDQAPLFKSLEPKDKYYMAYFIFYILGMTTLLPWNFFITADDVSKWVYFYCYSINGVIFLVLDVQISRSQY